MEESGIKIYCDILDGALFLTRGELKRHEDQAGALVFYYGSDEKPSGIADLIWGNRSQTGQRLVVIRSAQFLGVEESIIEQTIASPRSYRGAKAARGVPCVSAYEQPHLT